MVDSPKQTAKSETLRHYMVVPLAELLLQPGDPGYDVDRHGQLNAADWIERALRAAIAVPAGSVSRLRKSDQRWVRNVSLPDWAAWLPQLTGPSAIDNAAHARRDRIVMGHVRRRHFRPAKHHP